MLGYAGTISQEELAKSNSAHSYESGDIVGKDGAEQAFESYLQGDRGVKRVEINAAGDVVGTVDTVDPVQGNDVRLTIDAKVQKVAEQALQKAFADAARAHYDNAAAGAIVCLDANTGEVIAMASAPTYDPAEFIGGVSSDTWERLVDEDNEYPLSNRCIAGLYPAASTFKGCSKLSKVTLGSSLGVIGSQALAGCAKLKNLTLGYTLPENLTQKIKIRKLRIYATGENLFAITQFPGLDPEMRATAGYSTMRQYAIGLNVTF